MTQRLPDDWYSAGCAGDCTEQHTYTWGRCAFAPESARPEPTISIGRVEPGTDGQPEIALRTVPLDAWNALIEVAQWVSRGRSAAFIPDEHLGPRYPDAKARRALGALHEAGLLNTLEHAGANAYNRPAPDGPTIAEAKAADRNWDVEKEGQ